VLDVRPEAEYAAAHVRGAISIPIDALKSRLGEIPDGSEVVACCRGPYCVYADEAVRLLVKKGVSAARLEEVSPNGQPPVCPSPKPVAGAETAGLLPKGAPRLRPGERWRRGRPIQRSFPPDFPQ